MSMTLCGPPAMLSKGSDYKLQQTAMLVRHFPCALHGRLQMDSHD
jgi:hypothetical protein